MNIEMQMLIWSVALGLVQAAIAATGMTGQRGLGWAASARDGTPTAMTGVSGRLERARANLPGNVCVFCCGWCSRAMFCSATPR